MADEQILGFDNADVGRNHVAGREYDEVAGYQFLVADFIAWSSTTGGRTESHHITGIGHHLLQGLAGAVGFPFLHKTEDGAQDNHGRDNDDGSPVLVARISHPHIHHVGDGHQGGEHAYERIDKRLGKHHERLFLLLVYNLVLAIERLSLLYFFIGESQ